MGAERGLSCWEYQVWEQEDEGKANKVSVLGVPESGYLHIIAEQATRALYNRRRAQNRNF